jgi:PAS domain S-box-containing protein
MRAHCRTLDWCATPLGGTDRWPASLQTAIQLMLGMRTPAAVCCGPELILVYNDATCALFPEEPLRLLGRPARDVLPGAWKSLLPLLEKAWTGMDTVEAHGLWLPGGRGAGEENAWFNAECIPVLREDGACAGVLSRVSESPGRPCQAPGAPDGRATEAALEADLQDTRLLHEMGTRLVSEANVQVLYAQIISAAITLTHADGGTVQMLDEHTGDLLLLAAKGMSPALLNRFHRVDARSDMFYSLALAREGRAIVDFEVRTDGTSGLPDPDGTYRLYREAGFHSAQSTLLISRSGRVIGMLSTHWREHRSPTERELSFLDLLARQAADLIENQHINEALRASETRYRTLVENVRDYGIFLLDAEGIVTKWTKGAERVKGYTAAEAMGQHVSSFYLPGQAAAGDAAKDLSEAATSGRIEREMWRERKDGTLFWANEIMTAIHDAHGKVVGFTRVVRDLSEQRRSQEQREHLLAMAKAAQAQAEESNRAKDEFLAVLSHELRTPLAPILLWSRALRAGQVPPEALGRALDAIVQSAESQSRLIEDLLDLSRLKSGKLVLSPRSTPVGEAARGALEFIRPIAQAKTVALTFDSRLEDRCAVLDTARFQQILWNLLSNAVKFTPAGGRVSLCLRQHAGQLEVEVADTGQGIEAGFLPHLFQRFRQANMGESRPHNGLGIGLALCHQLAELHGGTIEAHSEGPGHGTLVRVRIPWVNAAAVPDGKKASAPSSGDSPSQLLHGLKVLLIEDDVSTRDAMRWTLERQGAKIREAASGAEALSTLDNETPEVIVCDIGLPGMNGYELIGRVLECCQRQGRKAIPACAVSAHARDADRRRAIEAGFELYVAKPVSAEVLVEALEELALLAHQEA